MDNGNGLKQKMAVISRNERIDRIRKTIREKATVSDEELVKAYEASENVEHVDICVHISSCNICIGKINNLAGSDLSEEDREFIKKSGNSSKFEMFPIAQKKLNNILTKIHQKKDACSIGHSDYMNLTTFQEEFLPYVKKMEENLEEIKREIESEFDDRMIEFEKEIISVVDKLFPDKKEDVLSQLKYIRIRGNKGYTSRISIDMTTGFGVEKISKEELRLFLADCKRNAFAKRAEDIIISLFEDLWQSVLSYVINISSSRYTDTSDLSGFASTRKKLKDRALKVRNDARPLSALDINELTERVEALSLVEDGYDAPDEAFDTLVAIYTVARAHYGYELSFAEKIRTGGKIPDWLKLQDIINTSEAILKEEYKNESFNSELIND